MRKCSSDIYNYNYLQLQINLQLQLFTITITIISPGAGAMAAHCSGCVFTVCVFTTHCCVCALEWVKCRGPISSMGHHT